MFEFSLLPAGEGLGVRGNIPSVKGPVLLLRRVFFRGNFRRGLRRIRLSLRGG